MFVVASLWKIVPGREVEAEERSAAVREILEELEGVELMIGFRADEDTAMAIIGYTDEDTYHRIVNDPNGPFVQAMEENKLEEVMTWVESWRGEELL